MEMDQAYFEWLVGRSCWAFLEEYLAALALLNTYTVYS